MKEPKSIEVTSTRRMPVRQQSQAYWQIRMSNPKGPRTIRNRLCELFQLMKEYKCVEADTL
jgi:hypothetical protein